MSHSYDYDYVVKVVVIGDSAVGKTSLLLRYADDAYDDKYLATIGVDFRITTLEIQDKVVKMQLWDTAGQERFRTITQNYYRGAHAVVLCFDLTDLESFQNCKKWMTDVEMYCPQDVTKILVGTKADLKAKHVVSPEDASAFAERFNCPYFETSAKAGIRVDDAFRCLAESIVAVREKQKKFDAADKPLLLGDARPVQRNRGCMGWLASFVY
jgi:Ras-related protein Rab-1A